MSDDAAHLEAKQSARRVEAEDDDRRLLETNAARELDVDVRQEKRAAIPADASVHFHRYEPRRRIALELRGDAAAERRDLRARVDDKTGGGRAVDHPPHDRQP